MILHKPSFSAALSHTRVPSYLLHAVCALAAPLSKQPRIRTTPPRNAGKHFAQEALSKMFDASGRLVCEPNLATAQALCLLQIQDVLSRPSHSSRYHGMSSNYSLPRRIRILIRCTDRETHCSLPRSGPADCGKSGCA